MKALPNTSFLPVPKSAPAGHTTAAAHLLWQVFPRHPCLEYKDNSGQSCPVRYTWTASFGRGLMFWQKRFNLTPQFVAYQFPGHLLHPHWYFTAYSSICQVLLGALSSHPRAYTWLSPRESWREAPERGGSPACGGTNSDRVQRTKQGAVSGAALQFLQAPPLVRRKNWLSARGAGMTERAIARRGGLWYNGRSHV